MKTEVVGENQDGSKHVLYVLEGFSATLVGDLWTIYKIKRHYPMTIQIAGSINVMNSSCDLYHFATGMQVAFELCSL